MLSLRRECEVSSYQWGGDELREDVKSEAYGTIHMSREYHSRKNKVIRISIR